MENKLRILFFILSLFLIFSTRNLFCQALTQIQDSTKDSSVTLIVQTDTVSDSTNNAISQISLLIEQTNEMMEKLINGWDGQINENKIRTLKNELWFSGWAYLNKGVYPNSDSVLKMLDEFIDFPPDFFLLNPPKITIRFGEDQKAVFFFMKTNGRYTIIDVDYENLEKEDEEGEK